MTTKGLKTSGLSDGKPTMFSKTLKTTNSSLVYHPNFKRDDSLIDI